MKKIIISIIIILTSTGCWNYHELNNYSIVTGIAIDKLDNEYEVSVLISNTPKSNSMSDTESSRIVVYSGTGDSIFTAIKDIGLISAKELYIGHFAILIISEDVAKEGIDQVIDLFLREASSKKNFYVAISRDCKAKDTLKIITPLSNFPSQNIADNLTSTSKLQGIVSNTNFNELLKNSINDGVENVINSISIIGNIDEGSNKKNIEQSEPKTYVKLGTLGLFKKDKLVYWSSKEESIGINIIRSKTKEMYIEVLYENSKAVIETTDIKTKTDIKLEDNSLIVDIDITGEAKFAEVVGDVKLKEDKVINSINNLVNDKVVNYVNQALNIAIQKETDILGFGLLVHQNYPNYFDKIKYNWNQNLKNIKFNVKSDIIIKTTGSSSDSLEDKND